MIDLLMLGGVVLGLVGVLEAAAREDVRREAVRPETLLRAALAGEEAAALRAEFRRRGVAGPARPAGPAPEWWR
jgi:hypothetical protein